MNDIPSKEQIINQAIKFHLKGNISEAEKKYKYLLEKGIIEEKLLSNYGSLLIDSGKTIAKGFGLSIFDQSFP